jgi:homoserine dehydrogenase
MADSKGALISTTGIDTTTIATHKAVGGTVAAAPNGVMGMHALDMVQQVPANILVELSTVNMDTGQPGLDCVRAGLSRGMGVVMANKGPIVHAFDELHALAKSNGTEMGFSATVCGALPVVNVGQRDLLGCEFRSVRGVFNSTTNYILQSMSEGISYADALRQAQIEGVAEANPRLDVEGWDTANKLVTVANSVLGQSVSLSDVKPVRGITDITPEEIKERRAHGLVPKLVARAEKNCVGYHLSVQPEWLPERDFLANVNGWEMGIVFDTDIMGLQQFKVDERGAIPTAAAVLRDVITLALRQRAARANHDSIEKVTHLAA